MSYVAALEAEPSREQQEASARASERGRAAAAAALSEDLELLRTTRRRQLEEVHAAAWQPRRSQTQRDYSWRRASW